MAATVEHQSISNDAFSKIKKDVKKTLEGNEDVNEMISQSPDSDVKLAGALLGFELADRLRRPESKPRTRSTGAPSRIGVLASTDGIRIGVLASLSSLTRWLRGVEERFI